MFWTIREVVLGVHILLGIIWAGGILFVGWGVFPAVKAMGYQQQQQFLMALMKWSHRLFTLAGAGVIVTGIALGTVFGPVRSWEAAWQTAYGHHLLLAFLVGFITLGWGALVSYRHSMGVLSHPVLWKMADNGYDGFLKRSLNGVMMVSGVEVLGFVGLLTIMLTF